MPTPSATPPGSTPSTPGTPGSSPAPDARARRIRRSGPGRHHRRSLAALTALATLTVGCSALRTQDPDPARASAPAAPPAAAGTPVVQAAQGQAAPAQGAQLAQAQAAQAAQAALAAMPAARPQAAAGQELNGRLAAAEQQAGVQQVLAAARRWGLSALPLRAPAPPAVKPELADGPGVKRLPGLPPVVYRVPTSDKVVFLTVDDGAEKDPQFAAMAAELGVPMSAFLSDYLARSDYGYFRGLQAHGVTLNNHTLTHPDLRRLGPDALRHEICDQQDHLQQESGTRPRLFRPPYGEYTEAALRTAASCGVTAFPLWNEEAFPDHLEWRYADQVFHPGDIVLTHFRAPSGDWKGTMPDMLRRVVDAATAQGFAVARLEDYL
ncbi:polysaccharide deacetylase family protein [Kitasatospora cineracea]|uniref:polysaccharide deacetylase family protein n=1 Tax=Kitasatospora cineracea TaxID=88074 RepID=UPI0033E9BB99